MLSALQVVAIDFFFPPFPNNCPDCLFCFHFLLLLALCLQNKQASLVSKCFSPNLTPAHCNPCLFCLFAFLFLLLLLLCIGCIPTWFNNVSPENLQEDCFVVESGASWVWGWFPGLKNRTAFIIYKKICEGSCILIYKKICEGSSPPRSPGSWEIPFWQGLYREERKPEADWVSDPGNQMDSVW